MPRWLAERFTVGQMAVMRIVADAHQHKGHCDLSLGEITAKAGVCRMTVVRAIKAAGPYGEGLISIKERPRRGRKNLTNVVRVVSREWLSWLARGQLETLMSDDCLGGYLPKFMNFIKNSKHMVVINVRAIPSSITSLCLDEILRPFARVPNAVKASREPQKKELSAGDREKASKAMKEARTAIAEKDVARAVQLLTRVLGYPENKYSADALELLGVARERNGQMAHAKAEYEAYLVRYPESEGAGRVRQRLAGIMTARETPKTTLHKIQHTGSPSIDQADNGTNWSISGSWSEFYFRDESFRTFHDASIPTYPNEDPEDRQVFQNELLSAFDFVAKWETPNYRSKIRFAGANEQSFEGGGENETSVATLFWRLRSHIWTCLRGSVARIAIRAGYLGVSTVVW